MDNETSHMYLNEIASRYRQGKFTKSADLKSYIKFFKIFTKCGLIAKKSYNMMVKSILSELYNAKPLKYSYLLERTLYFYDIPVPMRYLNRYRSVMMLSGLDERQVFEVWAIQNLRIERIAEKVPLKLDLRLPQIILDYNLAECITFVALNYGNLYDLQEIPEADVQLAEYFFSISKHFLHLSQEGYLQEAYRYIDSVGPNVDGRLSILQDLLLSFAPNRLTREEIKIFQREKYMFEFNEFFSFGGDRGQIKEWSSERDMSKRLEVWFQHEQYHEFIKEFADDIIINRQSIVGLIELGEDVFKFIEDFSLSGVINSQMCYQNLMDREPRIDFTASSHFRTFFMHL